MSNKPSRSHHYVPQWLLKNFSIDDKRKSVFAFDRWRGTSHTRAIMAAAAENDFNTITVNGETFNFEPLFQRVDDTAPVLVRRLTATKAVAALDAAERAMMAQVIIVQLHRTRLARDLVKEFAEGMRNGLRDLGVDAPIESADELRTEETKLTVQMILESQQWVDNLVAKHWILMEPPTGEEFWISDAPVVMYNEFEGRSIGFAVQGLHILFPLSSRLLLRISCPSVAAKHQQLNGKRHSDAIRGEQTFYVPRDMVDYCNRRQVGNAWRFVFAGTKRFGVAREMYLRHPELRKATSRFVFDGSMSPFPETVREGSRALIEGSTTSHTIPLESWKRHEGGVRMRYVASAEPEVAAMLRDSPHAHIEVFTAQQGGQAMGGITIQRSSSEERTVDAFPRSESLRRFIDSRQRDA